MDNHDSAAIEYNKKLQKFIEQSLEEDNNNVVRIGTYEEKISWIDKFFNYFMRFFAFDGCIKVNND